MGSSIRDHCGRDRVIFRFTTTCAIRKKTTRYDVENPGPGFGPPHKCAVVYTGGIMIVYSLCTYLLSA